MNFFTVAIIGRPNVGKSTLFNCLIDKRPATKAIVKDIPGLTRDRKEGIYSFNKTQKVKIIDTGGLEAEGPFADDMQEQSLKAMQEAHLIFFLLDSKAGILADDHHWLLWLHKNRADKKVFILVNKSDVKDNKIDDTDIFEIGFHKILRISAERKDGLDGIQHLINKYALAFIKDGNYIETEDIAKENVCRLVIIGRPNAGKSTLVNNILQQDRMIVSDIAGTTHDSVENDVLIYDKKIKLCDTAGLRKKKKINEVTETLITRKSIEMIRYAHVVALIIDATIPLERQDINLAELVYREGRGLIVVINKFDLVTDKVKYMEQFKKMCMARLTLKNIAIVTLSALYDENCVKVLNKALKVYNSWQLKIPTSLLNRWILSQQINKSPPLNHRKKATKMKFMNQMNTRPPKFNIFGNTLSHIAGSHYENFLINNLTKDFDLQGVPIRLNFISSKNPYADNNK